METVLFPAGGHPPRQPDLAGPPARPSPPSLRFASPSRKQNRFHLNLKGSSVCRSFYRL